MAGLSELRMYIVLNSSVKMSPGKAVAQAGHVVQMVTERMLNENPSKWLKYSTSGVHPKIALKADQETMDSLVETYSNRLRDPWCCHVIDVGRTQVAAGTLTALAFCPLTEDEVPDIIKRLKLY